MNKVLRRFADDWIGRLSALAAGFPMVLAYQEAPQTTFYQQALSCVLWALVLVCFVLRQSASYIAWYGLGHARSLLVFWGLLGALVLTHMLTGFSPFFVAAPALLNIVLATALTLAVLVCHDANFRMYWLRAVLTGLLLAALYNMLIVALQYAAPGWYDNVWIARRSNSGRADGNLHQPNLLATLMLWGLLAAVVLLRQWPLLRWLTWILLSACLFATGSRTALMGLVLLLGIQLVANGWQTLKARTAPNFWRIGLRSGLSVAVLLVILAVIGFWTGSNPFSRGLTDVSTIQRVALWRDVLTLICESPWTGVGYGQLNFAWTLSILPERAPDVFDHAHSLPLQWAVELGLPGAIGLLGLLGRTLWQVLLMACRSSVFAVETIRVAVLMLVVVLLHSLLEYPLWFSYFLLPTVFLLAWLVRQTIGDCERGIITRQFHTLLVIGLAAVALLVLSATIFAAHEYDKVAAIQRDSADRTNLPALVARARASLLFGQYGDYAAIMLSRGEAPLAWFDKPLRNVLDERLLVAYANALHRAGNEVGAAYVVQRAMEFPENPLFNELPRPSVSAPARYQLYR